VAPIQALIVPNGCSARCLGLDALEAERPQIERDHERVDHSDGVLLADVLVDRLW